MSFSDDSEDEEEIKNILYADLDQVLKGVSLFEQHNYEIHDYKQSKIWLEFKNLNKQREKMLDKIENDIQLMKQINQGIEDYDVAHLKVKLKDQLPNEIITYIKEQPKQKSFYIMKSYNYINQHQFQIYKSQIHHKKL